MSNKSEPTVPKTNNYLGQGLQDQRGLSRLAVLLISFGFKPHLFCLGLAHSLDGGSLSLTNAPNLLSLCLGGQHFLYPESGDKGFREGERERGRGEKEKREKDRGGWWVTEEKCNE